MKAIKIILTTFILAFSASALLDVTWIAAESLRVALVWVVVAIVVLFGLRLLFRQYGWQVQQKTNGTE